MVARLLRATNAHDAVAMGGELSAADLLGSPCTIQIDFLADPERLRQLDLTVLG
jgi:hypothetical protein